MINKISTSKWSFLIPVVLALAVNANVLQNGFVWDDDFMVPGEISFSYDQPDHQGSSETYFRPAVSLLVRIDRTLWGTRAAGYHLTNLLLHAAITFWTTLLAWRIFRDHPRRVFAAVVAGSLFAVHPVHAEAVAWIAGRNDLLPAFFLVPAMVLHHYLRHDSTGKAGWAVLPPWAILCALAIGSKESAFPLLFIFPLYDFFCWKPEEHGWRKIATPSTALVGLLAAAYWGVRIESLGSATGNLVIHKASVFEAIRSVLTALGFYIKHLFLPRPLNAFILMPERTEGIGAVFFCLGILSAAVLVGTTLHHRTRRLSVALWAVALGLAAPLLVPLARVIHAPMAERYLYLPSIGFVFFLTAILVRMSDGASARWPLRVIRPLEFGFLAFLIAIFSFSTFNRNAVWENDLALWGDTVEKSPRSGIVRNLLGVAYENEGRSDEAKREYRLAMEAGEPAWTRSVAANNLGALFFREGQYDSAEAAYLASIERSPGQYLPYQNLGVLFWTRYRSASPAPAGADPRSPDELLRLARGNLIKAVLRNPRSSDSYYVLGLVDLSLGRNAKARDHFRKVIELNPSSPNGRDAAKRLEEDFE